MLGAADACGYGYDADGNRTTRTVDTVTEDYGYAAGARLTDVSVGGAPTAGLGHDAAGRTIAITRGGADWELRYDPDGHVVALDDGGAPLAEYGFDGEGRRDTVTHAGVTRRYLEAPLPESSRDGPHAVLDDAGAPLAVYVWAGEQPLMRIDLATGDTTYYLADPEGSVIGLADATGAPTARLRYDGFGNPRGPSALPAGTLGDFRFHGMWLDPTGLYHVRARSYDPETGRFLSRDPADGDPQSPETFAPYMFANGNPYVWRDVTGQQTSIAELGPTINVAIELHLVALARAAFLACEAVSAIDALTGTATGEGVCYKRERRAEEFVVRLQAQGSGLEKSEIIRANESITVAQGIAGLVALGAQLTRSELRLLAGAFAAAARWISQRPPHGVHAHASMHFTNPGVRRSVARVDVEVIVGHNFLR